MVRHCDAAELSEFLDGLKRFNDRPDRAADAVHQEFVDWYSGWIVSLRLHVDSDYQRQAKDSLSRQRSLDWGDSVGKEEVRDRLIS